MQISLSGNCYGHLNVCVNVPTNLLFYAIFNKYILHTADSILRFLHKHINFFIILKIWD